MYRQEVSLKLLNLHARQQSLTRVSLAYAEMHLMLANLFYRYELEMLPGTHEAMKWEDRVIMHPHDFLHVKVKRRQTEI